MALLQIPTRTDKDNYGVAVSLEGADYRFSFAWNYRASYWAMSIDGVISGLALRVGVSEDLLRYVPSTSKPPGKFYLVDTSGQDLDPGIDELGGRVLLLYQESTS